MKIYISGPITGYEDYVEKFEEAETYLKGCYKNAGIINPAKTSATLPEETMEYGDYIRVCLSLIDISDTVCMLPGWEESKGARLERDYAITQGKAVTILPEKSADINKNATKEKDVNTPKKKKHRYGEYQHVLLTDNERDKLMDEFGEIKAMDAVRYLDEYIEMKGYKAKSHYLAIRKWVFDALDREKARGRTTRQSQLDDLLEQIRRDEQDDN